MNKLKSQFTFPTKKPQIPYKLEGWLARGNKYLLNKFVNKNMRIIFEFGSWLGLSADYIAKRIHPDCILICIDWWKGDTSIGFDVRDDLYEQFLVNVWKYKNNIIPIKMDGKTAMKLLKKMGIKPDMIYLDMDHSYNAVKDDLNMLFKCFPDTLILGDDILYWDGVRQAVNEIKEEQNVYSVEINQNCYALIPKWYSIKYNLGIYKYTSLLDIKIQNLYFIVGLKGIENTLLLELLLSIINYPVLLIKNSNLEYIKSTNLSILSNFSKFIFSSSNYFKKDTINSKLISQKTFQELIKNNSIPNVIVVFEDKIIDDIDYLHKTDVFNCKNKKVIIQLWDPLNTIANRIYLQSISEIKLFTDELTIQFWIDYWKYLKENKNILFVNLNNFQTNIKYISEILITLCKTIDKNSIKYISNYIYSQKKNDLDMWKKYENHPLIQRILSNNKLMTIIQTNFNKVKYLL